MTEKLYETDAYISCFKSKVLDCIQAEGQFKVILDKTAFFPEGGGQAADSGYLYDARVFDVRIEDGIIYHYVDKALKIGETAEGKIDFERRFAFMQNHTGEHIVSGVAHKLYGVNNVGFHLGEDFVTLDFDKELTREQLDRIEYIANQKVWQNLQVVAYYPKKEELKNIDYRSKKEIAGEVRLVEIKDTDICACCAPHLSNTGEIGLIKLLDVTRMRGGIRIVLKCGGYALCDYKTKFKNISRIAAELSVKQEDSADAVKSLEQKFIDQKRKNSELKKQIAELTVLSMDKNEKCVFVNDCSVKDLQSLADKLYKHNQKIGAVFSGENENYNFAICSDDEKLQQIFKDFKEKFTVRGGGRDGMVQGSVTALPQEIKLFFEF